MLVFVLIRHVRTENYYLQPQTFFQQLHFVFVLDMVDSQRQQAEERALKMKSVLVKTKKELAEAKKQVWYFPDPLIFAFLSEKQSWNDAFLNFIGMKFGGMVCYGHTG